VKERIVLSLAVLARGAGLATLHPMAKPKTQKTSPKSSNSVPPIPVWEFQKLLARRQVVGVLAIRIRLVLLADVA